MDNIKLNEININTELNKVSPRQWNQHTMHYLKDMQMLEKQFNMIINYVNNVNDELAEVKKELAETKKELADLKKT